MDNSSQNISLGGFDSFDQKLGDELRGERATLGKSLLDVQRDLRVKAAYISAIENCDVSVFPNSSFVAGYVRSYARYLGLDAEDIFARFCIEARFLSAGAELGTNRPDQKLTAKAPMTDPQAWSPQMPGLGFARNPAAGTGATLAALGPLLALALVVGGLGYGVWFIMQDIQKVEFAPIENTPMVAYKPDGLAGGDVSVNGGTAATSVDIAADPSILYNRKELDVPIVEPRDGPIFAINPDAVDITRIAGLENNLPAAPVQEPDPKVSETPQIPTISIVAQQEAWVRVYEENGTIIFEKILAAGEQYALPTDAPVAYLRAGNATSVYLMVDDNAFGPISTGKAVVRDIPLLPEKIASAMNAVSDPSVALQVAAQSWREMHTAQITQ